MTRPADRFRVTGKRLACAALSVVLVGQRLGVLLAEGRQVHEELPRVGFVERGGLTQFGDSIAERLLPISVDVGVRRRSFGEGVEACAQVRKRGLERRKHPRDGGALAADAAEVVLHEAQEALLLSAVEPDDRREVLRLLGREVVDLTCDLTVDVARIEHQHRVPARGGLGAVEVP